MKFRHIIAASLTLVLAPSAFAGAGPVDQAAIKVPNKVANQAIAFDLNQVLLLDGTFKADQELDRRDLLAANMEVLYYPFRREAKLDTPVKGSDSINYTATGHVLGHWLSAAAFMIRNTGDADLKKKADAAVAELARCQDARGDGFCGGFPPEGILSTNRTQRVGVPWYCLHKVYAGLLDMYVLTGNRQALEVLKKTADWAIKFTDPLSEEQFQAMLRTEHGGINEVLANLYGVTGEDKYLRLSRRFNHHTILDPFAHGGDSLENVHANTQFPKFIGVARQYELTGEPDLKTIATAFWNNVVYDRSYVTGGNSLGERFTPKARLSTAVGNNTTETCNEFNMLRLTRALFCQNPKPEYADYFERTLYNQILSTRNPQAGGQLYFQQLQSGRRKGPWLEVNRASQCCFGSGMESNAKYADGIYYHDASGKILFVNLFVPSQLSWKDKGITLRQETRYPDEAMTRLKVTTANPTELTLNVRRPWWATEGFSVTVNGTRQRSAAVPSSYVQLKRTWKTGDTVEVTMPMSFRMEGFKDNPKRAAVMYGPLVMAAVTQTNDRMSAIVTEDNSQKFLSALKSVPGKPLEFTGPASLFRTSVQPGDQPITFKPLLRMLDESYAVYWDQMSPREFAENPANSAPVQGNSSGQ
jgi:uncharacterized protein